METSLIYSKYVSGIHFTGRKKESAELREFLENGESVVIYETPKTGATSLIHHTLSNMKNKGRKIRTSECSLLNSRSATDAILRIGTSIIKMCASNIDGYDESVRELLGNTNFVFDSYAYATRKQILSLDGEIDQNDIKAVLSIPYIIGARDKVKTVIIIDEFQNIMKTDEGVMFCKTMEKVFRSADQEMKQWADFILCGSRVNAMKEIFEHGGYFRKSVRHLEIKPIDREEICDYIINILLTSGRVIDRDLLMEQCRIFKDNIWFINHLCSICTTISRGFITEGVITEAMADMIAVNEASFRTTMDDLTTFQICMLRAIIDGCTRFSSADVIERYNLNSSANVRRVKDALCKKEIITFNSNGEPVILDPLFEHWVKKYFFEIR